MVDCLEWELEGLMEKISDARGYEYLVRFESQLEIPPRACKLTLCMF